MLAEERWKWNKAVEERDYFECTNATDCHFAHGFQGIPCTPISWSNFVCSGRLRLLDLFATSLTDLLDLSSNYYLPWRAVHIGGVGLRDTCPSHLNLLEHNRWTRIQISCRRNHGEERKSDWRGKKKNRYVWFTTSISLAIHQDPWFLCGLDTIQMQNHGWRLLYWTLLRSFVQVVPLTKRSSGRLTH